MDGLFTRIISRKKKKYYFVSLSGCMRDFISVLFFIFKLLLYSFTIFKIYISYNNDFIEAISFNSDFKYLFFIIVLVIGIQVYMLLFFYSRKTIKDIMRFKTPNGVTGGSILMDKLVGSVISNVYLNILYAIALNDYLLYFYYVFKFIVFYGIRLINIFIFIKYIVLDYELTFAFTIILFNFIFWFLKIIITNYEYFIFRNIKLIKEMLLVYSPGSAPNLRVLDVRLEDLEFKLTPLALELGFSEEDIEQFIEKWALFASSATNIRIFNDKFKYLGYAFLMPRVIGWALITIKLFKPM